MAKNCRRNFLNWNRKNRLEKDGLFWLQSFTNQIGRNKEMDYLKYLTNPYDIYDICIYILFIRVYLYIHMYIYINMYLYIYTCIKFLGVLWLSPNFETFDSPNLLDRKSPSNWTVSCIAGSFIYIYVNIPLKPEASRVELHNCQISTNMLKQPIFLALGFHFVWRPRGWKVMIHDRMWSALVVWLAPVRRATIGVRYGQVKVENLWRLVQQTKFGVNLLLGI